MGIALLVLSAYLVGSVPFGVLVGRARGVDVRRYGSGNIGFSNVLRVLGPGAASVVLAGDVLKGALPVVIGRGLLANWGIAQVELWLLAVGLGAIAGHTFSVFLGFRGGRAVATTLGVLLAMEWRVGLIGLGVWIVVVAITRYISVASITAAATVPIYLAIKGVRWELTGFWLAIAALIIIRHIPNLGRLLVGTESKIGERAQVAVKKSGENDERK